MLLLKSLRVVCALSCVALSSCASPGLQPPSAAAFDAIVEDVFTHYRLPGIAVGVVRGGEVIYGRTRGELVAGSGRGVTADSLFKIASNSKAMTTALLARLVDQGKLRWDDPVVRHLPQFKMSDEWITREIQVRDLLIHNSGLREGAGDLMLWPEPNTFTRADILRGLAHLKPERSFRSVYAYDNLLYVVAGEVAAAAGGAPYEELIQRELFEPLGMSRCRAGEFRLDEMGNDVAQPHARVGESNVIIRADESIVPTTTSAAAGGIRCGLNDMLTWIRMWLDAELRDATGRRWLSSAQHKALWTAHMPMPIGSRQRRWDGSMFNAYGYGWRLSDVDGQLRVAHTGTLAGMYSAVVLLPELNAGFVFMINGNGGEARSVLSTLLTKQLTNASNQRTLEDPLADIASETTENAALTATPQRRPALLGESSQLVGLYEDPWFGRVSLCPVGDRVEFRSEKSSLLTGTLMHAAGKWLVDWTSDSVDAEPWLEFKSLDRTQVLTMQKVDPNADFSYDYEDLHFTRIGACP